MAISALIGSVPVGIWVVILARGVADLANTVVRRGSLGIIFTTRKRGEYCWYRACRRTGIHVRRLSNLCVDHVRIVVTVGIVAIPAELAAIFSSTVIRSVMIRSDFLNAIPGRCIDCHAHRVVGMAVLAHAVLAPGRIADTPEPERIGRCPVGNGIVVTVKAGASAD